MSDNNSTSNSLCADGVAFTLAGVSTIACNIVSLGVLLCYKMWQRFIYRLVHALHYIITIGFVFI